MSLLDTLKSDQLAARKAKDTLKATLLTTLIGEAVFVSDKEYKAAEAEALAAESEDDRKARFHVDEDGKTIETKIVVPAPVITDGRVLNKIRDFVKNAVKTKDALGNDPRAEKSAREIEILSAYLPKQLNESELKAIIDTFKAENPGCNMGQIMNHLKTNYADLYDGKLASTFARG